MTEKSATAREAALSSVYYSCRLVSRKYGKNYPLNFESAGNFIAVIWTEIKDGSKSNVSIEIAVILSTLDKL